MSRLEFGEPENALSRALAARREPYVDLTLSNPTAAGLPYQSARILAALSGAGVLRYQPHPRGLPAAREAVAEYCGGIDPERVVLTASTSEAYSWLFKLLCDAGDEVLVPEPSYPLFGYLAALESVRTVPYALRWDGEWHLDPGALKFSDRTRAVLVVSPGNPTGAYLKTDERDALARACAAHGCALICDEVFADYAYGPDARRARSVAAFDDVLSFALSGLSKVAGLPQLKLGWCVAAGPGSAEALRRLELIADTYLSVSTPVQIAARELLATRHAFQRALLDRVARNRAALLAARGRDAPWDALPAEGGWSAILSVPRSRSEDASALVGQAGRGGIRKREIGVRLAPRRQRARERILRLAEIEPAHASGSEISDWCGSSPRALAPRELHRELRRAGVRIDRVSVYRNVSTLLELGLLHRVLGSTAVRPCAEGERARCHHAIVCTACGSAREFHSPALERALGEVRRTTRYRVLGHLLELRGLCAGCR